MIRLILRPLSAALLVAQSSTPTLDPAYASELFVTGRASPDSGPVDVYDVSYPVKTKVGGGPIESDGIFYASVKPALVEGHQLVVEDHSGRVSLSFFVQPPRTGPPPDPDQ